jgi:hypothetical protein
MCSTWYSLCSNLFCGKSWRTGWVSVFFLETRLYLQTGNDSIRDSIHQTIHFYPSFCSLPSDHFPRHRPEIVASIFVAEVPTGMLWRHFRHNTSHRNAMVRIVEPDRPRIRWWVERTACYRGIAFIWEAYVRDYESYLTQCDSDSSIYLLKKENKKNLANE